MKREVHSEMDILDKFVLAHSNISNSDRQTQNLFHLELDGCLEIVNLLPQVIIMGHQSWELSRLVQTGSQKPRNLLDEGIRSNESIETLSQLLDFLLVLIQLLQIVSRHAIEAERLGLVTVLLISQKANFEFRTWHMFELDGSRETLVLLRIVVLEANLEVNSLGELALLVSGSRKYGLNALVESFFWNLTHGCRM